MSQPVDYPGDAATGPHTAVLPEGHYQQPPPGYVYPQPGPGPQQMPPPAKPSRLNKVAAWVGIVAGSLVIVAVLFGSGFYFGRETAPKVPDRSANGFDQGPMIMPMPRDQFERPGPGPGIVIPNGPTFQLPNIFPQFPMPSQGPTTQVPGQPPR